MVELTCIIQSLHLHFDSTYADKEASASSSYKKWSRIRSTLLWLGFWETVMLREFGVGRQQRRQGLGALCHYRTAVTAPGIQRSFRVWPGSFNGIIFPHFFFLALNERWLLLLCWWYGWNVSNFSTEILFLDVSSFQLLTCHMCFRCLLVILQLTSAMACLPLMRWNRR